MAWKDGPACGFWTRECVRTYLRNDTADAEMIRSIRRGPKNVFKDKVFGPCFGCGKRPRGGEAYLRGSEGLKCPASMQNHRAHLKEKPRYPKPSVSPSRLEPKSPPLIRTTRLLGAQVFPPDGERFFPEVLKGELGSCAVVAVADNMLGKKRGPEIDAHDTAIDRRAPYDGYACNADSHAHHPLYGGSNNASVYQVFRYNGPIKAYARDLGTKGDVYYWKMRRDEKQYGQEGQRANKFYMCVCLSENVTHLILFTLQSLFRL
eukprot:4568649-Pyramimonas_sp.AAC.1